MTTPMFQQYHEVKKGLKSEILFFRMGDFYEMFYEDAKLVAKVLGLALTHRSNGDSDVPMAGVPYHAASGYLKKLIQAGYKVAICDQVEDPRLAKGLVKRELTRVVTPGTLLEEDLLDEKKANYLIAIHPQGKWVGLAWLDLSTGDFFGLDREADRLLDEVGKIAPSECLVPEQIFRNPENSLLKSLKNLLPAESISFLEDWHFDGKEGKRKLKDLLKVKDLSGFGLNGEELFLSAASALLEYLQSTHQNSLSHISSIQKLHPSQYMQLDMATQRTLELVQTMSGGNRKYTLLGVLDRTSTPMGSRLLGYWVLHPLTRVEEILHRQKGVVELLKKNNLRENLIQSMGKIYDLERLATKVSTGHLTPRDLVSLRTSLSKIPSIQKEMESLEAPILKDLRGEIDALPEVHELLEKALGENPPLHVSDGGVIRSGFHSELDSLRALSEAGEGWLQKYQQEESLRLEIPSLKVGNNNIFGYYIEITHTHSHKVPSNYIRKQTLKNAERYITPELKEYEEKVLTAKDKALQIEEELFAQIRDQVALQVAPIQKTARAISILDCLASFSQIALERSYTAPEIVEDFVLEIRDGRHPVLEIILSEPFVPNDIEMSSSSHVFLITGPNMAGKSTYIRQIGLLVLMAQIGSLLPVRFARIGIVDKLFTRLGASDELYLGLSTFMVEMLETANILNNATPQSLVLLDEVGRGTSTYDGVSLAWAICEYLHNEKGCRTLFATHYHELTELPQSLPRMANYSVSLQEWKEGIIFLHKIQNGPTERSYGIHVAKLAGMPEAVLKRAQDVLSELEGNSAKPGSTTQRKKILSRPSSQQLSLFEESEQESKLLKELLKINLNQITPLEAMVKLKVLQEIAGLSPKK